MARRKKEFNNLFKEITDDAVECIASNISYSVSEQHIINESRNVACAFVNPDKAMVITLGVCEDNEMVWFKVTVARDTRYIALYSTPDEPFNTAIRRNVNGWKTAFSYPEEIKF